MKLKRIPLLGGMALAMVAFAAPAAQASGTWTTNHQAITQTVAVHLHGEFEVSTAFGGIRCPATATAELHPNAGSTNGHGTVNSFKITDTTKCKGTGILECKVVGHAVGNTFPWTMTATAEEIDVTGQITVFTEFDDECPLGETEAHFAHFKLRAVGGNPATAKFVEVEGEGIGTLAGQEVPASAGGLFHFTHESDPTAALGTH